MTAHHNYCANRKIERSKIFLALEKEAIFPAIGVVLCIWELAWQILCKPSIYRGSGIPIFIYIALRRSQPERHIETVGSCRKLSTCSYGLCSRNRYWHFLQTFLWQMEAFLCCTWRTIPCLFCFALHKTCSTLRKNQEEQVLSCAKVPFESCIILGWKYSKKSYL